MIMNICSCLQKTQIKLENVRAKNVQENTHTLQLLLSSTNVLEILRAQHSSGGEFTIVKARNPHAKGARYSSGPQHRIFPGEEGSRWKAGPSPGLHCTWVHWSPLGAHPKVFNLPKQKRPGSGGSASAPEMAELPWGLEENCSLCQIMSSGGGQLWRMWIIFWV